MLYLCDKYQNHMSWPICIIHTICTGTILSSVLRSHLLFLDRQRTLLAKETTNSYLMRHLHDLAPLVGGTGFGLYP